MEYMDKEELSLAFWAINKMTEYRAANPELVPIAVRVRQKDENLNMVDIGTVHYDKESDEYLYKTL